MNDGNETSLLDTHTPRSIIATLQGLEDATDALLGLVRSATHSQLPRLRQVLLGIDNYRLDALCEQAHAANRRHRYTATYLVLSLMRALCRRRAGFDEIAEMYDGVFTVRFRDVDPLIRGMTVQFLAEFVAENAVLRRLVYLRYLGWALNDKSDGVRRRALRGIGRLVIAYAKEKGRKEGETKRGGRADKRRMEKENAQNDIKGQKEEKNEILAFLSKHKERLNEMARVDVNTGIQREAALLLLRVAHETTILTEEETLDVLALDHPRTAESERAIAGILPEGIWDLERVHEVYKKKGGAVFKHLRLSSNDVDSFVLSIVAFVKEQSVCCEAPSLCFLEILCVCASSASPVVFMPLLEVTKENSANTAKITEALCSLSTFGEHSQATHEIAGFLCAIALEDRAICAGLVSLIKKLESTFETLCTEVIDHLRKKQMEGEGTDFLLPLLIQNFDVSDLVDKSSPSLIKCYSALWLIARAAWSEFETIQFDDTESVCSLIDFVLFFYSNASITDKEQINSDTMGWATAPVTDRTAAFRQLYYRLRACIAHSLAVSDEASALFLFKLVDQGIFPEAAVTLFSAISKETLKKLIAVSKQPQAIARGFFEALAGSAQLSVLARPVAGRLPKDDPDRFVFSALKNLSSEKHLHDAALVAFVPLLTPNEAIVLEHSLQGSSKFRTALLRVCKAKPAHKREEPETITII